MSARYEIHDDSGRVCCRANVRCLLCSRCQAKAELRLGPYDPDIVQLRQGQPVTPRRRAAATPKPATPKPGAELRAAQNDGATFTDLMGVDRKSCCGELPGAACPCSRPGSETRAAELSDVDIRRELWSLLNDSVPGFQDIAEVLTDQAIFTTSTSEGQKLWSIAIEVDHGSDTVTLDGQPFEVVETTEIKPVGATRPAPTSTNRKGNKKMAINAKARAGMIAAVSRYTGHPESVIAQMSARELTEAVTEAVVRAAEADRVGGRTRAMRDRVTPTARADASERIRKAQVRRSRRIWDLYTSPAPELPGPKPLNARSRALAARKAASERGS